ncbi:MAG: hypothetical protein WDO24_27440 [Pseudomonadota bacterium]
MDDIRAALMQAVDVVMTCEPDYIVMGMSAETFWDGLEGLQAAAESARDAIGQAGRDGLGRESGRAQGLWRDQAYCRDHSLHAGRRRQRA